MGVRNLQDNKNTCLYRLTAENLFVCKLKQQDNIFPSLKKTMLNLRENININII